MRVRYRTLASYGITPSERNLILEYCKKADEEGRKRIADIVRRTVPAAIYEYVLEGVLNGSGYYKLYNKGLDYSKVDFYAYRRKAIAEICEKEGIKMKIEEQLQNLQAQIQAAQSIGANLEGSYIINGLRCAWSVVLQGEMVYRGIEPGVGFTKRPEFVIACHEIFTKKMNQVQSLKERIDANSVDVEEIKRNREKNGKNEGKEMKSFRAVFEEMKKVYGDAAVVARDIMERERIEDTTFKSLPAGMSDRDMAEAKMKYYNAMDALKAEKTAAQTELKGKVDELRKTLEGLIATHYTVNPGKMDSNTIELIKLGGLTPADYRALSERYATNITMLKVLQNAVSESCKKDDFVRAGGHGILGTLRAQTNPDYYRDGFQELVDFGGRLYGKSHERHAFDLMFEEIYGGAVERSADFTIEE